MKTFMPLLPLALFSALLISSCATPSSSSVGTRHPASGTTLAALKLELDPLPTWAQDSLYSNVFFNINSTMTALNLSRLEAVELQNRVRDAIEANPHADKEAAFQAALSDVKEGRFESGFKPITFESPADFVLALDGDETLLMQWYASGKTGNVDLTVSSDYVPNDPKAPAGQRKTSPGWIKFTPGTEQFLKAVRKNPHCKGIVIFSAKADLPAIEILRDWKFSTGEKASDFIHAIFTRNHLVIGPKAWLPSKDLRILDPELKHVLLIDDNPGRVMQPQALRAQPKFDADHLQKHADDASVQAHYATLWKPALSEIFESVKASEALGIPFTQAYLPYSYSGERIFRTAAARTHSRPEALKFTRLNPELQEAAFFFEYKPAP